MLTLISSLLLTACLALAAVALFIAPALSFRGRHHDHLIPSTPRSLRVA